MERLRWFRLVTIGLAVAVAFGAGRRSAAPPPPRPVAEAGVRTFADSSGQVVPNPAVSIVGVESFSTGDATSARLGSGFVVSVDGLEAWVATAGHVVTDGAAAVYLPGERLPHLADTIVPAAGADVALLHVPHIAGVAPVRLSGVPASAWAAEVDCVRWPNWTYQAYPVALHPGAISNLTGVNATLQTPVLGVLPGCSGGPLTVYPYPAGAGPVVVGVVTEANLDPIGVQFVTADQVQALLRTAVQAASPAVGG